MEVNLSYLIFENVTESYEIKWLTTLAHGHLAANVQLWSPMSLLGPNTHVNSRGTWMLSIARCSLAAMWNYSKLLFSENLWKRSQVWIWRKARQMAICAIWKQYFIMWASMAFTPLENKDWTNSFICHLPDPKCFQYGAYEETEILFFSPLGPAGCKTFISMVKTQEKNNYFSVGLVDQ